MTIATGSAKQVIVSKESTWGVAPAAGTGKYARRTSMALNLERAEFQSAEISSTAQTSDARNGTDNVSGTLSTELSAGTYEDQFAALLRGPWVAGVSETSTDVAFAASANTLTRTSGSWITDGFRVGDYITVSGSTSNNVSGVVLSVTALVITVDAVLVTEVAGDTVTVEVPGAKLVTPILAADRTDDSFTIEQWFSDIGVSRLATGCKFGSASVTLATNSIVTCDFEVMGKDMKSSGSAYFTSPAQAGTGSVFSSNFGAIYSDGARLADVTGMSFEITGNMEAGETVLNTQLDGTRPSAGIFLGRVTVSGDMTVYFSGDTMFEKFRDEIPVTLVFRLDGEDGEGVMFKFPRVKLGNISLDDAEVGGVEQSVTFSALLNDGLDPAVERSTVIIQDFTLVP